MSTTGLGILLGVLGSVSINVGNNLQSLGMSQLEKDRVESAKSESSAQSSSEKARKIAHHHGEEDELDSCQSRTWIMGTTIFVTGSILNFAAFAFAPQVN